MPRPKIESIRVYSVLDENADTSFYGEYGNSCTTFNCIDRQERGDRDRNEYRYFNPATEYGELDYERMEAYNKQLWWEVGIISEAKIKMPSGQIQTIQGGSLWGIESDSETSYFDEVAGEVLAELKDELKALGFTDAQIRAVEADRDDLYEYHTNPYRPRREVYESDRVTQAQAESERMAQEAQERRREERRESTLARLHVAPHVRARRRPQTNSYRTQHRRPYRW